jgi:hypothetical protein
MINNIKAELEKRTGLPANVVDQVINTLGEVIGERYPQYTGIIGPLLGVSTAQGGATGTTGATGGGLNLPDLGNLGGIFGGQSNQDAQDNTTTNKS